MLLALCLPKAAQALGVRELAVIVNTWDPLSVQIGEYYAAQRRVSFQNFIRVGFRPGGTVMSRKEFAALKSWVENLTMPHIQAYAITWASPYRVECMSITTALAFGFDPAFCEEGCKPTRVSPYFNSEVRQPFAMLGIRPTMSIAAMTFENAKALIDRGTRSDGARPAGSAYLLSTTDAARNIRSATYPLATRVGQGRVPVKTLKQNALRNAEDVLFYFTGITNVEGLDTLHFVPGAIADHLTSFGGALTDSGQMSALRWLEAGATGSYGAVVEPCNIAQKFPSIPIVMERYLNGETLIESYWKSVAMPGQGIFVGDPLAAPFRPGKLPELSPPRSVQ